MRVLGIDPGSNCTGYGVVESHGNSLKSIHWGSIKTKPKALFPDRLKSIYDELTRVVGEFQPDIVAIEDLFFAVNAQSTIKLGQTRGVAILAAVNAKLAIAEYTPLEVKLSVVGYGRADKNQVRDMVTALLGLRKKPEPLDASDALAVAICHLHNQKTSKRLQEALSSRR